MKFAILGLTAIAGTVLAAPLAAAPPEKTIARGPSAFAFFVPAMNAPSLTLGWKPVTT